MATLNLEPAISTRYRIERVMYRGRCSIETGSYTAPQPIPRVRLKVPGRWRRSPRKCMLACQLHSKESALSRFVSSGSSASEDSEPL